MVIYNGRELSSKFVKDNKIVEINSPIQDVMEAIEVLREEASKETPDLSRFFIQAYSFSDQPFETYTADFPHLMTSSVNVFDEILSDTAAAALADASATYVRPAEFVELEKDHFNQRTSMEFTPVDVSAKEVLDEMMGSYGILPTLWNEDKPVSELKSLSAAGEKLIRMYPGDKYRISKFNGIPNLQAIEFYQSLTPYEKRVVSDGRVHPAKVFQIANMVKANGRDTLLTEEMLDYLIDQTSKIKDTDEKKRITSKQVAEEFTTAFAENNKPLMDRATDIFKEMYHGFAPRVLNEYMWGILWAKGQMSSFDKAKSDVSDDQIREIASAFNRQNVSKVAKYKNPVLLALSERTDFGKVKDNIIQTLGTSVRMSSLKDLFDKDFPEWLNNHPDVTPAEVLKIVEKITEINKIPADMDTDALIRRIEDRRGYEQSRMFEEKHAYKQVGYKFADNELAIKGRHIVAKQGNLTMRMLAADEYKNFTIGIDTHCCQRYGDAGESCVYKYTSDPFAGAVVIERGDKVIAQGFVWVDVAADTFVFDNVELDNDREVQQFTGLFSAYAKALPYANVHIGTGYNQGMNGWGQKVLFDKNNPIEAKMPTTVDGRKSITSWGDGNCYSDYHTRSGSVARVIKHMGIMKLPEAPNVTITTAPDEPTRWDELAKPDLCFMLNDWEKSIEERLRVAREFRENPTAAMQMQIIQRTPTAIASMENPTEEVQEWILSHYPDYISQIQNPCASIQAELIRRDPTYISHIENPSEEMILDVVSRDGMMLEHIQNPTQTVCEMACTENGYARQFVPSDMLNETVNYASVCSQPKVIANIEDPSELVVRAALQANPNVISIMNEPSEYAQVLAVQLRPSVINQIENPCYEAVKEAVSLNGLMIRNFQNQYPELREVALRQNGYAAGCLKNLTIDEARMALDQNRGAVTAIKDKDILDALVVTRPRVHQVEPEVDFEIS